MNPRDRNNLRLNAVDDDLVALYIEDTQQSEYVVRRLLACDVEVPSRRVTDRVGFTAEQDRALAQFRTSPTDLDD